MQSEPAISNRPAAGFWHLMLHGGWFGPLWFVLVALLAGAWREAYVPATQSLSMLGAVGAPGAGWFNLLGYIVTGVVLLLFVIALERGMQRDGAARGGRLGTGLLMVSALAFAAQGVFAFDPAELDAATSQRHASALAFALLGLMAGAMFVAASLRRAPRWRMLTRVGPALAALLLVFLVQPPQQLVPALAGQPGHAQRLILAVYLGWFVLAALVALRRRNR